MPRLAMRVVAGKPKRIFAADFALKYMELLPRLAKEAESLRAAGKLSEAIAAGQKAAALARQQYGDASKTVASWQEWVALRQEQIEQWQAAQQSQADVLAITTPWAEFRQLAKAPWPRPTILR